MNTACSPCTARAWRARGKAAQQPLRTKYDLPVLDGLTAKTLKDIGAPEWVQARAQRAQDLARQRGLFERASLHWR